MTAKIRRPWHRTGQQSLAYYVSSRILIAALFAITLQTIICLAENYLDELYFGRWYVKTETTRIAESLAAPGASLERILEKNHPHYGGATASSYAFRVLDPEGRVIAAANAGLLKSISPLDRSGGGEPDMWMRKFDGDAWFHLAGGIRRQVGGRDVFIEVATLGDPAGRRFRALWHDIVHDVWIPLGPTIFLTAAFAIFTLRGSLRPLERAAGLAGQMQPGANRLEFDLADMPREAALFCSAINRLLERNATLISSQDRFIACAAHELRTPLAIVQLELGKIRSKRARRIENDVTSMGDMVGRLLELARIDALDAHEERTIDIAFVVCEVVRKLEPLVDERDCVVEVVRDQPQNFLGDPMSVREAVRNLVENAVKHSPRGAKIRVTCGPGPAFSVDDSGPGLNEGDSECVFEPFYRGTTKAEGSGLGLAIVRQVASLHRGTVEAGRSDLGGARFRLRFAPATPAKAKIERSAHARPAPAGASPTPA